MSNILETNVLIIGKSGVGKSSLLNYIFDKELMETGTGRPVTKKGIFTEELKVSDNFIVKLSDTWGLEANKAKEWEELIKDEIKKHDCEDISDWFHTILFCISAKSSRVEDFEKKIIKGLIEDGNKIIVILTHSDTNNIEGAIDKMSKELRSIGLEKSNIIKVSSVGKKLLSGRTTERFGKEKVLHSIQSNLWKTICNKLPKIMDKIIDDSLDNWYLKSEEYLVDQIKWYSNQGNKKLGKISEGVKSLLDIEMKELNLKLKEKYDEVYDYYFKLVEGYHLATIENENKEESRLNYMFDFKVDLIDRFAEGIATFFTNLIPLGIFFTPLIIRDHRIDSIMELINQSKDQLSKDLKKKNKERIEEMKRYAMN